MHSFFRTLTGVAAAVALGAVLIVWTPQVASAQSPAAQPSAGAQAGQPAAQPEKKPKDQAEYDLINAVIKDLQGTDAQKTLADLNTWSQKYPESDFKDDRLAYYQQAYASTNPPQNDKVLDYGAQLLSKDLNSIFKEKAQILQILFRTAAAVQNIQNPTPEQLATGDKAARQLQAFIPAYFDPKNKPAGATDAQWAQARAQLEGVANGAIAFVIGYPCEQAVTKKDWPAAEQCWRKALEAHPDEGLVAYKLGSAIVNQKDPAKFPQALYFIAAAVSMDPAKGGIADQAMRTQVDAYLKKAYVTFHGSDEGLADLKAKAATSLFPPADFNIKTSSEVSAEKEKAFKEKYPELALWMGIKGMLAGPDGDKNFADMKDTLVKGLKGTVMGGEPDCNPKKILVAVPEPNQTSTVVPEITLKLETAIKGKPVQGQEFNFQGQPTEFSKDPFMLTMDVDKDSIPDLKVDACTPPRATPKKGVGKKAPAKKK